MLSTRNCTGTNKGVAQYVKNILPSLSKDSLLIMIISPGKSEGFYAAYAIEKSSEDIARDSTLTGYKQLMSI